MTRPRADSERLAAALIARGLAPLIEPMLVIECDDGPPPDLAGVQAVLCTSANGVRALARRVGERVVPVLAVGAATAEAAREAGFARVTSADGNADDLARLVLARLAPADGKLLHVSGRDTAGDLAGRLRARGFAVERRALYQARPAAQLSAPATEALAAGAVACALFFSPRTGAIFVRLAGMARIDAALARVAAVSISAATDAALEPLPFRARGVAARPDQPALLAALDRLLEQPCPA